MWVHQNNVFPAHLRPNRMLRMFGDPYWLGFKVLPEHGILVANGASLFRVETAKSGAH